MRWSSRADSLFTFLNAFPVVVSSLEVLKDDHDEKAAQYIGAILKFDFIIALVNTSKSAKKIRSVTCHTPVAKYQSNSKSQGCRNKS
jgi:hypothetical protein